MNKSQFIEDNLIVFSKNTFDAFLRCDNPADLIALYGFYYYTAKWQKTNQIKATDNYVCKGLHWGKDRLRRAYKELKAVGLVERIARKNKQGKVEGHYVKVNYIWKRENLIDCTENPDTLKPTCGKLDEKTTHPENQKVVSSTSGKQTTNALSANNRNALIENKKNACSNSNEFRLSNLLLNVILERKSDFKKPNLKSWAAHIDRMIRLDNRKPEAIEKVIRWCQKDCFWKNNILSTESLRRHFDKLELQMEQNKNGTSKQINQHSYSQQHSKFGEVI